MVHRRLHSRFAAEGRLVRRNRAYPLEWRPKEQPTHDPDIARHARSASIRPLPGDDAARGPGACGATSAHVRENRRRGHGPRAASRHRPHRVAGRGSWAAPRGTPTTWARASRLGGFIELPLARVPGGKLSYEMLVCLVGRARASRSRSPIPSPSWPTWRPGRARPRPWRARPPPLSRPATRDDAAAPAPGLALRPEATRSRGLDHLGCGPTSAPASTSWW